MINNSLFLQIRDKLSDDLVEVFIRENNIIRIVKYSDPYDNIGTELSWDDLDNALQSLIVKAINHERRE